MKKLYTLSIALFTFFSLFAQSNIAVTDGNWGNTSTWSQNRLPVSGDVVEIPEGITVQVIGSQDQSAQQLNIKVWGRLEMNNGRLTLGSNSKITLYEDAQLVTTKNNSADRISIGSIEKYNGTQGILTGLMVASSNTGVAPNGFMAAEPVILPVKFVSFSVAAQGIGVQVKWSTAEEVDAAFFEVQRSNNGRNWVAIGQVAATGNSTQLMHYQFTNRQGVQGTVYYRIKQADRNGKTTFTTVQTVAVAATKPVHIFTAGQTVAVQFAQPVKDKMEVSIIDRGGLVIAKQAVTNGTSQVVLTSTASLKGAYFVTVANGAGIAATQQIIL